MGYSQEGKHRDSPGYFTKEYEDRKRARSPTPRGERPNRGDRNFDRQEGRRNYSQERRRDSNQDSRRDPDRDSRRDYNYERRSRRSYSPGQGQDRGRDRSRRDYTPE